MDSRVAAFDEEEAIQRVLELMAIPAASGDENGVAESIRHQLLAAGARESEIFFDRAHEAIGSGSCGNLFLKLPCRDEPARMFSAHMDTVPICVGCVPERQGDVVTSSNPATGLGADDRAGCSVVLTTALHALRNRDKIGSVIFAWFVQEEIGLKGARNLDPSQLGRIESAFNFDGGTPEKLTIGATGGERMRIVLKGRPSHAGLAPEQGISALLIACRAIAELASQGWIGKIERPGAAGTSNVGVIQGGGATNVVVPEVEVRAEARSHDAAMRVRIVDAFRDAFERAAQTAQNTLGDRGRCEFESTLDYDSFRLDDQCASVRYAEQAVRAVGREPVMNISGGGVDANWLFKHGIPAVTLGCGQRNVHTTDEALDIPDYLAACRIALHALQAPPLTGTG